ncbi:MAG TPA: HD domain-containing phosphohydrolase [Candidatus Xenobia bacterium]
MTDASDVKRILLADDEPLIRHLARKTLAVLNFQILEASNGNEALTLAREQHPDLIVLDVRMPGKSGIEVCRTLRQESATRSTPIILLAGDPGIEELADGDLAGANHFFTKPFSPLELIQKVREFLDNKKELPTAPSSHRSVTRPMQSSDLQQKDREQLLLYAADLSTVYAEEQQKREELRQALEKLREMEKMKDIFVSLVSHELRTPLSIIKGYVSLMDQILATVSQGGELQRFTQSIQRAANRLEDLIKELLDFSKMKHGIVPMEKKAVELPSLVKVVMEELVATAAAKDIELTLLSTPDLRPIQADPIRLREAITHIVKNAIAFTLPSGRVTMELVSDGVWTRLRVADTGVGIAPEEQERIFIPFYQVEEYLTRTIEGLGLGLSIARHIVEDHSGTITVESELGKGSVFVLSFPLPSAEPKEVLSPLKASPERLQEISAGLSAQGSESQLLVYAQELSELYSAESVKTQRLEENLMEMERTYIQTIAMVAKMVDLKDAYSGGHTDRVTFVARCVARKLNPAILEDRNFTLALLLHDLGKIGVAEELLQKAERLTDEEWAIVRSHVEIGTRMLGNIQFLTPALVAVRAHHERWDGRGYPDGLRGEEIPLVARIISVADAFEAMTSDRPYRKGLSLEEARKEIQGHAGTQFDPKVVDAFIATWEKISQFRDLNDDGTLDSD